MGGETRMDDYLMETTVDGVSDAESDRIRRTALAAPKLLAACKWFLSQLETGVLIRNTYEDHDPGYHLRAVEFVQNLAAADEAAREAESR